MTQSRMDGVFQIQPLPIVGNYNLQRFRQFGSADTANWYPVKGDDTKRPTAMYPVLGRKHIHVNGFNQLIFGAEPRGVFKSVQYAYIVDGNSIFRVDNNWNIVNISGTQVQTIAGPIYFSFIVVNEIVFACFTDQQKIYIYREDTDTFTTVTDPNAPGGTGNTLKPGYIATFGNRITVSALNSSQFFLSQINLGGSAYNSNECFTIAGSAVFAQEQGIIRQMGVLNNTLYIFSDYLTGVWFNIPSVFSGTGVTFPWKTSSTYNWNFGIANPGSLDIDFGYLAFLARNSDGLLQYMMSTGGQPQRFSSKAIDTLLQKYTNLYGQNNPFLLSNSRGFLYQYENTIFYRVSGGEYTDTGLLDQTQSANCIEYSFEIGDWHRCIELNGERSRVNLHVYFNNKHLVSVVGESTVYEMSGQFYFNERRNPDQSNPQALDAYLAYPFRYERVMPIISENDYAEFETEYVEIDFVFGESNINYSISPFQNAQFIIDENLDMDGNIQYVISETPDADGQPIFMLADGSNTPSILDNTYNYLLNPSIELFFSDDGGVSFQSADNREFSQMGVYIWKMRWYQLGASRNRVYRLVCISAVPIVVLGAVMNTRRISGGAN